jgi:polysaccharide biosynthesis transport protein
MARKPPASPQEVFELWHRRKWWIILPAVILPLLIAYIGSRLPKQYESDAVILVNPASISADVVKSSDEEATRLEALREEVLNRPQLEAIATELNLFPKARQAGRMEHVADRMEKAIDIDVIKALGDRGAIQGFRVSYTATDPQVAQAVVSKIAQTFIAENSQIGTAAATDTHEFLSQELAKAKTALDQQEQQLQAFKTAHLGTLPEQETANLTLISQYQSMLQANSEAIDRANQQRVYLESMLNIDNGPKHKTVAAPTQLELQLQAKEDQLTAARQVYTDSYPDVIRLQEEVAALKQQVHAAQSGKTPEYSSAPTITQQFQSQLVAIEQEIRSRTQRQAQVEAQMAALQGRVQLLPAVQGQYQVLTRDYQELQQHYQDLLEKQQNSGMAAALQQQGNSADFEVIDPPSLPLTPSGPNLLIIDSAGVMFGLLVGIVLGVLMDLKDATIHSAEELERYFDMPMIVSLPSLARDSKAS